MQRRGGRPSEGRSSHARTADSSLWRAAPPRCRQTPPCSSASPSPPPPPNEHTSMPAQAAHLLVDDLCRVLLPGRPGPTLRGGSAAGRGLISAARAACTRPGLVLKAGLHAGKARARSRRGVQASRAVRTPPPPPAPPRGGTGTGAEPSCRPSGRAPPAWTAGRLGWKPGSSSRPCLVSREHAGEKGRLLASPAADPNPVHGQPNSTQLASPQLTPRSEPQHAALPRHCLHSEMCVCTWSPTGSSLLAVAHAWPSDHLCAIGVGCSIMPADPEPERFSCPVVTPA